MEDLCRIETRANRLTIVPSASIMATGAVRENLFFEYQELETLENVPDYVKYVTAILNLAPLVWALDLHLRVPFKSRDLEETLEKARLNRAELLPGTPWSGRLHFEGEEIAAPLSSNSPPLAMYSCGLDSTHLVYKNLADRPNLLKLERAISSPATIRAIRERARGFAKTHDLEIGFVTTNAHDFLEQDKLRIPDLRKMEMTWWTGVQYGISFVGAAAPIAYLKGAPRIHLASGHTAEVHEPNGADPDFEGQLRWPGVEVIHDAYEISRQNKIAHMLELIGPSGPRPPLVVCFNPRGSTINCGSCEKCLRTMTGLVAEGENPRDWGLPFDNEQAIAHIRQLFERRKVNISPDLIFMWRDIEQRAVLSGKCPEEFAEWLQALDMQPQVRSTFRRRALKRIGRKLVPAGIRKTLKGVVGRR